MLFLSMSVIEKMFLITRKTKVLYSLTGSKIGIIYIRNKCK